ncbi:helix-turn-helix domain-containing protein [Enterobacter hormaechei]
MYLFLEGELSLLRASDGLVVVTVYEPHLFGIAEMIQPTQGHLLRAERESNILRLDADKAAELFRAEGVWEDGAALLSYHTAYLIFRDAQVLQQRTYSVIRNHLQEMILLPEETRLRTTILEYIQDRTLLSRSSILNVLSALKQGEYISFKRGGYLLEVRHLPESF